MSQKDWPASVMSKTPVVPAGSYAGSAASGVWTLDQVAYWNKQGTWPGLVPGDPYFDYVSLLLTGDGTNGAQNNTFLDSSTNNFTITRNGNTTQGTFSPYGNLWSFYSGVEGNGDSIYVANNTITNFGTGDFTVECWINQIGTAESYFINSNNGTGLGCLVTVNGGGVGHLRWFNGNSVMIDYNAGFQLGTWYHIAICRSGTTTRMFINGALVASISDSSDYQIGGNTSIGGSADSSWCNKMYISNVRIVKGVALYTAAFSPSSAPLTAVTGTSLLACQSNRFKDNSSNNYTFVTVNSPKIQRFSPFNPPVPYSTSTIGGSGYFDGSGDYLSLAADSAFACTGDFTYETWFYSLTNAGSYNLYIGTSNNSVGNYFGIKGSSYVLQANNGGEKFWAGNPTVNAWTHIALVRSGSTVTLYQNGVSLGTNTDSNTFLTSTNSIYLANYAGYYPTGYFASTRLVKGTAVYTTTFTPPTSPLTAISGTSLLCNMTNAGIPDAAMMNDLETVGNAQVSTSVKKYGTGSLAFDGAGDYLTSPTSPNLNLSTGDWTIEGWYYPTAYSSGNNVILSLYQSGTDKIVIATIGTSGYLYYLLNGSAVISTTSAGTANTWSHFALVRSGSTTTLYLNGSSIGTTSSTPTSSNKYIQVGADGGGTVYNGYIDDLRITKGYARYTANFTPPTAALPTY